MLVSVETPRDSVAPVIHRDDVMVFEGHDRDKVTAWEPAQGDQAAIELFVLIDDAANTSLGTQLEDIRHFIMAQPAAARIGVAYMQNGIAEITQNLTTDHKQSAKALRLPFGVPGVNASPYFSLGDLIKRWPETTARREVLMVSDGIDRFWGSGPDDPWVDSLIEQAQRAGVVVFAIYTPGIGHYGHSFWRTWWTELPISARR
jgi:uncharacterized protein